MNTSISEAHSAPTNRSQGGRSVFGISAAEEQEQHSARLRYLEFARKEDSVRLIRSATDPLHGIDLNRANPLHRPIMDLLDTPLIQRMKKISQLSAVSWVYPDALQPRFGHVVGSACLTADILENISYSVSPKLRREIEVWGPVVVAFAMTHDIGHIAPGSHVAHRVWFSGQKDAHETAGGWNTDRGDWVRRDGIFTGVMVGHYDLAVIRKYLTISDDGEFVIKENGAGEA